jgi:hypothetical protein
MEKKFLADLILLQLSLLPRLHPVTNENQHHRED